MTQKHPIPMPNPDLTDEQNPERNRSCPTCGHRWRSIVPKPKDGGLWSVILMRCPECEGTNIITSYEVGEVPPDLPDMLKDKSLFSLKSPEEMAKLEIDREKARAAGLFNMPKLRERDADELKRRAMVESGQMYGDLLNAEVKWDTKQMRELFTVHQFLMPFVVVTRKSDGVRGMLEFTPDPRWYFNFVPDDDK